ncbi:MAG: aminotransferase class I/II-fold pyridoxal phosphate-dependent enzyme [Acidobacteria bacterium]|nr:aminotransferase class I/II-fold pyridoxal phosphate-dependent enzyme [Acidobacteriota bacterium]NIM62421.1 aminotransferase class I/II-fold pyridoxal phosphate-dependent enzyme [Acidobacteriota bacterium]NIO60715.1 aminotransferase class I/II-fold pyridoxal phosphate-dependent enzyme [Acidobacteriota bacterium]NIQ31780.1 aminotransferase class I/II-fold pyridoxal phosphate-dependent enzyme [Acidobacteriota bacterium]NIQ87086.1 aminotransferase class I/II-fold pyridoxal phosphate-dependent e
MILQSFPPMGVYETLFKFADATDSYMGEPGTHPWAQGFPLTTQLPGGPPIPRTITFTADDMKYPKATGNVELCRALAAYFNEFYDAGIDEEHVAVFAGGRPGIFATLAFLQPDTKVVVEETEYTPYYDILERLRRDYSLIPSNETNRFRPSEADYETALGSAASVMLVKSNPCNPTGVATRGDELKRLVEQVTRPGRAALIDEAYEFYCDPQPESALRHIDDIDATDIFVVGAATKGLQVPGARVGWVVAAKKHIEIFRNYSSFGMGGVSRASQLLVTELLELERARHAREAVRSFYSDQRQRYGHALAELGFELHTGDGGFYHWGRLPGELTADQFNRRLFEHNAGILPGPLCDMKRRKGADGPLSRYIRFSFGPLDAESFDANVAILKQCL